jgi:hypothetical protein
MHDGPSLLEWLGLRVPDLVAGFAGGVVNSFVFRRGDPWSIVGSMVVGAFTANYLGEHVSRIVGLSNGAADFLVGVAGMAICQGIVAAVQSYKFQIPGNPP